jgi:hypothetical protein
MFHKTFVIFLKEHPRTSRSALRPSQPPAQWTLNSYSPVTKWLGHEADRSLSSMNGGAIDRPILHLKCVHMDSFIFILLNILRKTKNFLVLP